MTQPVPIETLAPIIIAQHAQGVKITGNEVRAILQKVKGTTFAGITTVTVVPLAAAHKAVNILKVSSSQVQLFNNLKEFTDVYTAAVKRSASKIAGNDAANIENFESQENYYEHTDCFSLCVHKGDTSREYLFAIFNSAQVAYMCDNKLLTKEQVAAYCTPSNAKKLLTPEPTYNVANDVTHNVPVRAIKLESIVTLKAMKQVLCV